MSHDTATGNVNNDLPLITLDIHIAYSQMGLSDAKALSQFPPDIMPGAEDIYTVYIM